MNANLGKWQKWHDKRFKAFLKQFYVDKIMFSFLVAKDFDLKPKDELAVAMAVFEKVASPAVYLEHAYKAYLVDIEKTKEINVCENILS